MEIVEFTAEDTTTVERVVDLENAAARADSPWRHPATVATVAGMMRHGWDGEPPRCFVGRVGAEVMATGQLWLTEWDNRDLAWLDLVVHPRHRRHGYGTAMLEGLLEAGRAAGRTKVGADTWDAAAGIGFAEAHGFERKAQAINRRQVVAEVDPGEVRRVYDEAREAASSYELVRVAGRTPEDLVDRVAVMTAAINDAPTDDLDIEDEEYPPERIRSYEDACLGQGLRLYRLLARHRGTGVLAGHTVVAVESERPTIAEQHDTSVVREHRGHRLGLLLKAGMLLWLAEAEPQLETIDTWNAESNAHMISVNEQLGYRAMGRSLQFQRAL